MAIKVESQATSKKTFFFLWFLCIVGSWSVFPYVQYLGILPESVSVLRMFITSTIQSSLIFGLVCFLSFKILPKTDLETFQLKSYPAVISGVVVGLSLFFFDKTIFQSSLLSGTHPPFWAGALASIYGAVNEEVLLRLFLLTFVYFLINKCLRIGVDKRLYVLWTANIFVAIIFGLGHLPAALKLTNPSAFEIFRVLFLNGIAGIVFGWLYWSRGLWTAMLAHFVTDLMIHVFLIAI